MKNLKILLLLITFSSISHATMYSGKTDHCIEDFYISNGTFYYLKSKTNQWNTNTSNGSGNLIVYGYEYNSTNNTCRPIGVNSLGLTPMQYNFLLALCGLIFGGVFLFFTVELFTKVGGKK